VPEVPLALLLLRSSRWFDRHLLAGLEAAGWPRLTPAQSLVFAQLQPGGTTPAALARRLGTTRQSAHELVSGLARLGLLELTPDPARRGGRLVTLTGDGVRLTRDATRILAGLEDDLGADRVEGLRALIGDLGAAPE
jgi:DNA-binding MarR family transcriptional regulator